MPPARSRRLRWAAPVVVAAVIGMVAFIPTLAASATPSLAPISPQDLLVKIHDNQVTSLSGTIALTANLGIPNLSQLSGLAGQDSGFNPTDLLSGSHQARIWVAGPDLQRIALPSSLAETDVIHNGTDVWIWESSGSKVTHLQGAAHAAAEPAAPGTATTPTVETPAQLAAKLLSQIDPSTAVTVGQPTYVANHAAYVLDLAPRAAASTIAHIEHRGGCRQRPATQGLDLRQGPKVRWPWPSASRRSGSPVRRPRRSASPRRPAPGDHQDHRRRYRDRAPSPARDHRGAPGQTAPSGTTVVGTDWSQVAIVPTRTALSAEATTTDGPPSIGRLVLKAATPVSGSWGSGRLLETALVNVLVLDDGRTAVGAVTPAALESAVSAH